MTDPVFGNLEYEYGWNGTVEIDCFGKMEEIDLTVCGEEDTPVTELQRNSYKAFMAAWDGIKDGVAEEIGKYYISLRKELGYDEEYNSCYPPDENGMGIRFLNEKIDETGYQDIVF